MKEQDCEAGAHQLSLSLWHLRWYMPQLSLLENGSDVFCRGCQEISVQKHHPILISISLFTAFQEIL